MSGNRRTTTRTQENRSEHALPSAGASCRWPPCAQPLGLSVTACGAGNESEAGGGDGGGEAVTLDGGGATSQAKAEGVWRANYQDESGNTVNYEEVGSGTGRENFNSGAYSFAGSDSYLNDDEGELSAAKERCGGSDPIEVPAYVSPIAVSFNVKGVDSLNMSAETIANIFNGTITKWNDDAIAADNAGVELPDTAIAIIHRSDDSGTTTNFTDYLFKASDGAWATEADGLWPEDLTGGQGLEGTSGVIGGITDTDGSIGYADDSAVKDTDLGVVSIGVGAASTPRLPRVQRRSWRARPGPRVAPTSTWRSTSTARSPTRAPTRCCSRRT